MTLLNEQKKALNSSEIQTTMYFNAFSNKGNKKILANMLKKKGKEKKTDNVVLFLILSWFCKEEDDFEINLSPRCASFHPFCGARCHMTI